MCTIHTFPGSNTLSEVQNSQVRETKEFEQSYCILYKDKADFPDVLVHTVLCYNGQSMDPRWIDDEGECDVLNTIDSRYPRRFTSNQVALLHFAPFQWMGVH